MRLPPLPSVASVPGVAELAGLAEQVLAVGPRLAVLLADVERLVRQADRLLGEVDGLVQRIETTRAEAQRVVRLADSTRTRADGLVAALEPHVAPLERLQPMLERLADTTSPEEVDALVALVDTLPVLASQVEGDVLPVMRSLGTVAPDVHDLLDLTRELNAMLGKVPGLGRIKRKVDEQQAEEAEQVAGP